ncbi:MAG: peptidyl-prolyl cis-trans isomerase [Sphingomonadales bacterium]|nr:peptidyl-prolyl cis-trans isomerase [Sphingomonadales bacterium]
MARTEEHDLAGGFWSFSEVNGRRSLLLCAAGASLGLLIAGLGLFTAQGTRTSSVPAEDIALVNTVPILMSDYQQQVRTRYNLPVSKVTLIQRQRVLEDMIREELYVQRGVELGMQTDTIEVRQALVGAVETQAEADAIMAQPDEGQLKAYYGSHRDQYADEGRIKLTDYVLPDRDLSKATAAVAALRLGKVPASALGLHLVNRMNDGEEFYFAARIHLGDALFVAARSLNSGQVSDPIATADGIHILVVHSNSSPQPHIFEDVRDRVLNDYIADQAKVLTAGTARFLRKRADVTFQRGFK